MLISYLREGKTYTFYTDADFLKETRDMSYTDYYLALMSLVLDHAGHDGQAGSRLYFSEDAYQAMSYAMFELKIDESSILCVKD